MKGLNVRQMRESIGRPDTLAMMVSGLTNRPEDSIGRGDAGPPTSPLVDGDLMAQGEYLELERGRRVVRNQRTRRSRRARMAVSQQGLLADDTSLTHN